MRFVPEASLPPKIEPENCWFINEKRECTITSTKCTPSDFCINGIQIKKFLDRLSFPGHFKEE